MMLSISRCCLNPNHPPQLNPTSTSKSLYSKSSHLAWPESQLSKRSWKNGCLALGAATLMMINISDHGRINVTVDEQQFTGGWELQNEQMSVASTSQQPVIEVQKWSDKRTCAPWHLNSLETIVPENLPRPFTRRRWQAVESIPDHASSSSHHHLSPSPKSTLHGKDATSPNHCFLL